MTIKHRGVHNPKPRIQVLRPDEVETRLYGAPLPTLRTPAPVKQTTPSEGAIEARKLIALAQKQFAEQQVNPSIATEFKAALVPRPMTAVSANLKKVIDDWAEDDASLSTKAQQPTQATQTKQPEKATMTSIHVKDENNRLFTETKGTSRATFAYIKANPYCTTTQAVNALYAMGHKKNSTTALFSAMIQQGIVSKDRDGKLTAMVDEYVPIKHNQQVKLANAVRAAARAGSVIKAKTTLSTKIMEHVQKNPPSWPERQAPTVNIDMRAIKNRNTPEGIASLNATVAQATPATVEAPPTPKLLTAAQVLETLSIKEAHILYRELHIMFG